MPTGPIYFIQNSSVMMGRSSQGRWVFIESRRINKSFQDVRQNPHTPSYPGRDWAGASRSGKRGLGCCGPPSLTTRFRHMFSLHPQGAFRGWKCHSTNSLLTCFSYLTHLRSRSDDTPTRKLLLKFSACSPRPLLSQAHGCHPAFQPRLHVSPAEDNRQKPCKCFLNTPAKSKGIRNPATWLWYTPRPSKEGSSVRGSPCWR